MSWFRSGTTLGGKTARWTGSDGSFNPPLKQNRGLGFYGTGHMPMKLGSEEKKKLDNLGIATMGETDVEVPLLVPGLSKDEYEYLTMKWKEGDEIPAEIRRKALGHAIMRMEQGLPAFMQKKEREMHKPPKD